MTPDPLAPLMELPGVVEASDRARDALGRAHRHRANLRGWPLTAAEAALRAARASSVLDGGPVRLEDLADAAAPESGVSDPVFAGALRVAQELEGGGGALVGVWQRAPLQALARLHMLAAAGQVDDDQLGRPRAEPEIGPRLELLADLVTGRTRASAPVLAAVAHGELLTLKPFGSADGVVARAVSRLVTIASGLDPHGLGVPEVRWMRQPADYRDAARGFADGHAGGCGSVAGAVLPGATGRCAGGFGDCRIRAKSVAGRSVKRLKVGFGEKCKAGGDPKDSDRRPLARNSVTRRASHGLRGMASAILRRFRLQPHPKGRRRLPLFAIPQARNTSAIIAAMTQRGCREPC